MVVMHDKLVRNEDDLDDSFRIMLDPCVKQYSYKLFCCSSDSSLIGQCSIVLGHVSLVLIAIKESYGRTFLREFVLWDIAVSQINEVGRPYSQGGANKASNQVSRMLSSRAAIGSGSDDMDNLLVYIYNKYLSATAFGTTVPLNLLVHTTKIFRRWRSELRFR